MSQSVLERTDSFADSDANRHARPLKHAKRLTLTQPLDLELGERLSEVTVTTPVKVPSSSFSIRWSVFSEKNHHRGWRLPAPPAPNLDEDLGFLRVFGPLQGWFLYLTPPGQQEGSTSFHELCQRLFQWVQATGISKSQAQVENIAKIVWSKIEERAAA